MANVRMPLLILMLMICVCMSLADKKNVKIITQSQTATVINDISGFDENLGELLGSMELDHPGRERRTKENNIENENNADIQKELEKLTSQSHKLANDMQEMFKQLERREENMITQMDQLRISLDRAMSNMKQSEKEVEQKRQQRQTMVENVLEQTVDAFNEEDVNKLLLKRQRRDEQSDNIEPYKACVYIDIPQDKPPKRYRRSLTNKTLSAHTRNEDIDLSNMYWLKVPEKYQDDAYEKFFEVVNSIKKSGRDVLIIPVAKDFSANNEQVENAFLRSITRVNPVAKLRVERV